MDPLVLLLSIHPNYWTRKGHHHQQQYGQILSSPPIEWPAVILGRNSRDSITHRKTRYQLQITVLRVLGHTPPGHRDPLSFLCLREKTSTVHRVVMCVGDKGTVCRHLWILRVLHAAPSDSPPFLQLQCMNSRDTRRWTFDPRGRATRQFWVISFIKGGLIIVFVAHKE